MFEQIVLQRLAFIPSYLYFPPTQKKENISRDTYLFVRFMNEGNNAFDPLYSGALCAIVLAVELG